MLDKNIQETMLGRLQKLTPDKLNAFDMEIGPRAAEVMLYDLLPELDFLLLENLKSLEGHQYQPERVLGGELMAEQQQVPVQQPKPQPQPVATPQGALGGLVGNT